MGLLTGEGTARSRFERRDGCEPLVYADTVTCLLRETLPVRAFFFLVRSSIQKNLIYTTCLIFK